MSHLRLIDLLTIAVYLAAVAGAGLWAARKNDSTDSYFLGKKGFSGIVIALSMVGTSLSSITFLALPAAAFALDWRLLVSNWAMPLGAVLAILVFVPFYRRARVVTAFEFLEARFGRWARLYAACSFILFQWIRVGSVLFLVSVPVALLLGVATPWVIVLGGLALMAYTVSGGFDAVVWTDVIQILVLIAGGILAFVYLALRMPGGLDEGFALAWDAGKFHLGEWSFDLTERTAPTLLILGLIGWTGSYATDQTVVQRIVAARSDREARKAVWLAVLLSLPVWTFFYLLGTGVWSFYQLSPDPAVASMNADQVFPHFILTQLPQGVSGLIVAAILAAAMSSLDSSINSVSTTFVNDVYRRHLVEGRSDTHYLRAAKLASLVSGVFMIVGGLIIWSMERESILDLTKQIASIFGGCTFGLFMLGFFTRRVSERGILLALPPAILVNVYLGLNAAGRLPEWASTSLHNYWINMAVNAVFATVAIGLAYLGLAERRPLRGLTVWTTPRGTTSNEAAEPRAASGADL